MRRLSRRQLINGLKATVGASFLGRYAKHLVPDASAQTPLHHLYVSKNGTPVTNVQTVISLAGGIERFVGYDDAVVLKPNGQWPLQGYTHTLCMKALIDVILDRPGGFGGEVVIAEHVHRDPVTALNGSYCWNMSAGYNRTNNWPDMSYFELVDDYHTRGFANVNAIPLYDTGQGGFVAVTGPAGLGAGQQGWVRSSYTTATNGRSVRLSYPILRSPYSGDLIDLRYGVWRDGAYTGQPVRLMLLPTLNNHGSFGSEDYAGPTSALKCHLGVVDFTGPGSYSLHGVGYNTPISPAAMGESVGHLITQILAPTFYMTCAEYTGYRGRTTTTAAQTKTVGLCVDPVTLDYWMCKYVMYPCAPTQTFMNPDNDFNLRRALLGCHSKGVGTVTEAEMIVHLADLTADLIFADGFQ